MQIGGIVQFYKKSGQFNSEYARPRRAIPPASTRRDRAGTEWSHSTLPRGGVNTPRPVRLRWRVRLYARSHRFRPVFRGGRVGLTCAELSTAHALDQFFNRCLQLDDLFHHRVTRYPAETTCSQCAARIQTHTYDNARNDEQAHNDHEEQCIYEAASFLSRVCCTYLTRSSRISRLTPTPCLPAQGMC
jgi:hypothetical protein